jgi:hypothetical protein
MNNILKLFKKLDYDIQYYYWLYNDNFILQDLSYKFIYNDLFNFNWNLIYSYKKLKKLYIKLKLELDQAIKDNDKIKEFSNKMKKEINWYYTNI